MASVANEQPEIPKKQLSVTITVTILFLTLVLQALTLGSIIYFGQKYLVTNHLETSGTSLGFKLNELTHFFSWLITQTEALFFLIGSCLIMLLIILAPQLVFRPLRHLAAEITQFSNGNWERRVSSRYNHEFGMIAQAFNLLASDVQQHSRRLDTQTSDHNDKMVGLAKLTQIALKSPNMEELVRPILMLTLKHFCYQYAALYLLSREADGSYAAMLRQGAGEMEIEKKYIQKKIILGSISETENAVAKVFSSQQPAYAFKENPNEIHPNQADIYHELALPITIDEKVIGCLSISMIAPRKSISSSLSDSEASQPKNVVWARTNLPTTPRSFVFNDVNVAELQIIANQISLALRSFHSEERLSHSTLLSDHTQTSLIYQAGTQIAQSENKEDLLVKAGSILQELPHSSALLLVEGDEIKVVQRWPGKNENAGRIIRQLPGKNTLPVSVRSISAYFKSSSPIVVNDIRSTSLPQALIDIPKQMGCDTAAFLPTLSTGKLTSILIMGQTREQQEPSGRKVFNSVIFSQDYLQPYHYLIDTIAATVDKLKAQEDIQKKLAEVQTLWNISQAISVENDVSELYKVIHYQAEKVMGKLNSFAVLLYDEHSGMIQVPYITEEGKSLDISPFPMGEGLTSIVLRSGKPLLISENMEKSIRELGAKTVGAIAKSWLGVPLKYGGDTFGVIIAQDIFRENRYSEEDLRLLSTIASQVALVIRNVRLLETSKIQARTERILNQISGKIRRAMDMESILKTTVDELAYALNARKAKIKIEIVEPDRKNGKQSTILANAPHTES